jgi:Predicted pPIWI-associating nuclease
VRLSVIQALGNIDGEVKSLQRLVSGVKAKHVNKKETIEAFRSFVYRYFSDIRPELLQVIGEPARLADLDVEMQELLRCTQRRASVSDYRFRLKQARNALSAIELLTVSARSFGPDQVADGRDQAVLDSLKRICEAAATSYEQALIDLADANRKSWRGTSVEFREALREVLDTLAPDDAVTKQPGFKQEPNTKGPTMKQKGVFILRSRRPRDPEIKAFSDAINVIEELVGKLVRSVYTRSSVAVHIQMSRDEAVRIRDYVTLVLTELLEIKD